MASLHAQHISKSYGKTIILDDLSLSVEAGEFVSLLGPSGSGKSTFLKIVAGLIEQTSGHLQLNGKNADFRKINRSFVFQDATLLPFRNALENVMLPLELQEQETFDGIGKSERIDRAKKELSRVGLEKAYSLYPDELSGGMRMRVSLARALITQPKLLLLDEPFSALDENTRHTLQDELRHIWKERGMTTLFVTHSVSEAVFLSNRVVVLSKCPSKIVLDHKIDLEERCPKMRTNPEFLKEIKKIYDGVPIEKSPL